MTISKILLVATVAAAGIAAALLVQHQKELKLHKKQEAIEQQNGQLAGLLAESRRLSNAVAPTANAFTSDQRSELETLRGKAANLRQKTNELSKQQPSSSPKPAASPTTTEAPKSAEYYAQLHKMAGTSPADGVYLGTSIRMFADDHEGRLPSDVSQLTPYLAKANITQTEAGKFEVIFQGSLNDLKNISPGAVVLFRERQPWPAPDGKMGRVYGMADGTSQTITADDNFQAWESKHVIQPSNAIQSRK